MALLGYKGFRLDLAELLLHCAVCLLEGIHVLLQIQQALQLPSPRHSSSDAILFPPAHS